MRPGAIIAKHYEGEQDETDTSEGESEEDESKNWDCETILSTLSNVSNRPGKIGKIKLVKKPKEVQVERKDLGAITEGRDEEKAAEEDDETEGEDIVELPEVSTDRPKGETSEERKQRKAAVK